LHVSGLPFRADGGGDLIRHVWGSNFRTSPSFKNS
jgi:hypothetical protein